MNRLNLLSSISALSRSVRMGKWLTGCLPDFLRTVMNLSIGIIIYYVITTVLQTFLNASQPTVF